MNTKARGLQIIDKINNEIRLQKRVKLRNKAKGIMRLPVTIYSLLPTVASILLLLLLSLHKQMYGRQVYHSKDSHIAQSN